MAKEDIQIDEQELLAAVRKTISEATKDKEESDKDDESAVQVKNPLDPDANEKSPVVEETKIEDSKVEEIKTPVQEQHTVNIKEILNDSEQLSEEFKEKAEIIFNTAVKLQVEAISTKLEESVTAKTAELDAQHEQRTKDLQEQYEKQLSEAIAKFEENLSEKIDGYFGALSEEWMQENELALEGGIQAELIESFIGGMRTLFEQHYVDMPEEKRDLLKEANEKSATLEAQLAAQLTEATEAKSKVAQLQREKIIEETAHSMTELDASRFRTLMEDFEFDTEESFAKKAATVKDSFFKTKAALTESKKVEPPVVSLPVIVEERVIPVVETPSNSAMDLYVKATRGA
jgi:hypothetical protein